MIESLVNRYLTPLRARYRASPIPDFLVWWGRELGSLLPQSFKSRLMPPKPEVWILPAESGGGDLRIWRPGEPPQRMDVFGAGEDLELLRGRWREVLSEFTDGEPEIRVCLGDEQLLAVPVNLPMAVEGDLGQALGYQLDQVTPFRADQVLYGYRVVKRDMDRGRIDVDLRLVPKSVWSPLDKRLLELGIRPHAVDILAPGAGSPAPEGFNLLPESERPRYVHARARLNWGLAAAAVVMLGLVMAQSLYLRGQTVERLSAEAHALRDEAREVLVLQQRLEDAVAAANFLAERRREQPVNIAVLAELTDILPDDMWLQQFRLQGDELFIQGLADGAQRLVDLVNESSLLDDAEFRGSITVDQASGRERFQANARVNQLPRVDPAQQGDGDATAPES